MPTIKNTTGEAPFDTQPVFVKIAFALIRPTLKDQRCIDAAKRKVIALDKFGLDLAFGTHDVIQVTAHGIRIRQIDGRAKPAFTHHLYSKPRFNRATST